MKQSWTDELSQNLSESLSQPLCFGVTASQETCVHALWNALPVSFVGDTSGILLFVALDENRKMALKAALSSDKPAACPNIQITTPQLLAQLLAADQAQFCRMFAQCRRVIVWLHPDDWRDHTLDDWFETAQNLPNPNLAYFHVPESGKPVFERFHPQIRWFSQPRAKSLPPPVLYYLCRENEPGDSLDRSFWKACKKRRTLVSGSCASTLLLCEEAAHHQHLQTCRQFSDKDQSTAELLGFTEDAHSCFEPSAPGWDHYAIIDAPFLDGIDAEIQLTIESPKKVSLVVSNHFSLLNALCASPETAPKYDVFWIACQRYCQLYNSPVPAEALKSATDLALLDFWQEQGIAVCGRVCGLTPKGRSLFAGIPHAAVLRSLASYRHQTHCESPNHENLGSVDSAFLQPNVRFMLGAQQFQCAFHNCLERRATLKTCSESARFWLDALPVLCSAARAKAMRDAIFLKKDVPGLLLTETAAQEYAQIQSHFEDIPQDAQSWIEITPGAAQWWTFAGAQNNAILASFLQILSPKLAVSYGNLHLYLQWQTAGAYRPEPVIRRFAEISQRIGAFAASGLDPQTHAQALQIWQKSHLWRWLFSLIPPAMLEAQFDAEISEWSRAFQKPQIFEVQSLHAIDPILPQNRAQCQEIAPQTALSADVEPVREHLEERAPKQPEPWTPIERGDGSIMRTRHPWSIVTTPQALAKAINLMLAEPFIGLDVETTLYDQRLCLIQIGCARQTFIIDPLCVDFSGLAQVFENPNLIKVIHNASFETKVLAKYGIQIHNIVDTLKLSRKRYGMKIAGGHSLRAVCLREFGYDMDKTNQTSRWDKRPLSADQLEYAALDAEILVHLYRHFML